VPPGALAGAGRTATWNASDYVGALDVVISKEFGPKAGRELFSLSGLRCNN
jgi:hypothetical protein